MSERGFVCAIDGVDDIQYGAQRALRRSPRLRGIGDERAQWRSFHPILHQRQGIAEPMNRTDAWNAGGRVGLDIAGAFEKRQNPRALLLEVAPSPLFPHLDEDGRLLVDAAPSFDAIALFDRLPRHRIGGRKRKLGADCASKGVQSRDYLLRSRMFCGRLVIALERRPGIGKALDRIDVERFAEPVVERVKACSCIGRRIPLGWVTGRNFAEEQLIEGDGGEKYIAPLGAGLQT